MDINALNELIAKARETATSVAQTEERVAAFTAELAKLPEIKPAPARSIGSFPKREFGMGADNVRRSDVGIGAATSSGLNKRRQPVR